MNNKDVIQKAKEFYENMSDEELKERLIEAGFKVIENGGGQVYFYRRRLNKFHLL